MLNQEEKHNIMFLYCSCKYCYNIFTILIYLKKFFNRISFVKEIEHIIYHIIINYDKNYIDYYEKNKSFYIKHLSNKEYINHGLNKLENAFDKIRNVDIFIQNNVSNISNIDEQVIKKIEDLTNIGRDLSKIQQENNHLYDYYSKNHNKYKLIKENMFYHGNNTIILKNALMNISKNPLILKNFSYEFLSLFIIERFHKQTQSLISWIQYINNKLELKNYIHLDCKHDNEIYPVIRNDIQMNLIINQLKLLCSQCFDNVHEIYNCRKKHCSIICQNLKKLNQICLICQNNTKLGINYECKLKHCDNCFGHHNILNCPRYHCYIICSKNGKYPKKNCEKCTRYNSKNIICHQIHCIYCSHHHSINDCKFKK